MTSVGARSLLGKEVVVFNKTHCQNCPEISSFLIECTGAMHVLQC